MEGSGTLLSRRMGGAARVALLSTVLAGGCGGRATSSGDRPDLARAPADLRAADLSAPDLALAVDLAVPQPDLSAGPCGMPCVGDTPLCDPLRMRCVACLANADCPDQSVCKKGACAPGCAADHAACGDAGSCDVDLGVCRGCNADRDCLAPDLPLCDVGSGTCVPCKAGHDTCPKGQYCVLGGGLPTCAPGCKGDFECIAAVDGGAHAACCNHVCANTFAALSDCGGCGMVCNQDACCAGHCTGTSDDPKNCGGCAITCPSQHTVPSCHAGVCGSAGCLPGFADCDGNPANGCETATGSDLKNCGACGVVCALDNALPICLGGACSILHCSDGFLNCNGLLADGCEVNDATDLRNCGTCGNVCNNVVNHGTPGCAGAMCTVVACDPGYGDCNRSAIDGCEAAFASDPQNCSGCGIVCPTPPHVLGTCTATVCGLGGCQKGFADCNSDPGDGCEADLSSDARNCKVCGVACVAGMVCHAGQCVPGVYGGGGDGALTVAKKATVTINNTRTSASGLAGQLTLTVGSSVGFVAGQNVLIHQTQGKGAGSWEIAGVNAVGMASLTLLLPLAGSYSTSGGDAAQVVVVPQYTDVNIDAGGTLTAPAWDGESGGILAFQASGTATVAGTVTVDGKGFRGVSHACTYQCQDGTAGESSQGTGAQGVAGNGAGGGGGGQGQDCGAGGGGGYGAAGGNGPAAQMAGTCANPDHPGGDGGSAEGAADLVPAIFLGGAGGEGGADEDGAFPGGGGNGGGIVVIQASTLSVSGAISAAGGVGGNGDSTSCGAAGCGMGGGGGGAGGGIRLLSDDATLGTKLVVAPGGGGGTCSCGGQAGGASGATGRIAVKAPMLTGTTNPTYFGG